MSVVERSYPFSPRSARRLQVGDLIGVPLEDGSWACLQVTVLFASGQGSASSLVVTPLPWRGTVAPSGQDVAGLAPTEHGMTGIELFTKAGLAVTGWAPVADDSAPPYEDPPVGTVHRVWGYQAAIRLAGEAAERAGKR